MQSYFNSLRLCILGGTTEAQFSGSVNTLPHLPNNTVAVGYKRLQVISVFARSNHFSCIWIYSDLTGNDPIRIEIFTPPDIRCEDRDAHDEFGLKCSEDNEMINSSLIILRALRTNVTVATACSESYNDMDFEIQTSIDLHVKSMLKK